MNASSAPGAAREIVRIFVSYAREDKHWLDASYRFRLVPFLADSLRREGVEFWIDQKLVIADDYQALIESEIDRAQIALLIVSQSFLNSEFIEKVELPRIAERAQRGNMLIAPVLVEPCGWRDYPLIAKQHMVPAETPLIDYTENEARWAKVRYEILENLKTQVSRIRASAPAKAAPAAASGHSSAPVERMAALSEAKAPVYAAAAAVQPGRAGSGASTAVAERPAAEASAGSIHEAIKGVGKAEKSLRVALLYKRSARPDDHVLGLLEAGLGAAGHEVFIDRHLTAGIEWATEIERQVRGADAVIPLLSATSILSEMLEAEVKIASDAAGKQFGKPRILPVRVNFEESLPEPFFSILGRLQYALWRSPGDDRALIKYMLDSLAAKEPPKLLRNEVPGGTVPLESPYYIVQAADLDFAAAIENADESIVCVKGARQMGKTSLLARGMQQARQAGRTVVSIDLERLNQSSLAEIDSLYKGLGEMIAIQLNLDVFPDDTWKATRAPNINFENYIRRVVLSKIEGHLILAMDELDRLFSFPYANDVFGMFRGWHEERRGNPDSPWKKLTMAFVYATEPHLFITNQNMSPFNVGTRIEMHDFGLDQVEKLNHLYKDPMQSPAEVKRFYELLNGQPYLTRRGFYEMTTHGKSLEELEAVADTDEGPFGDHLRRILVMLAGDKALLDVVRSFVNGQPIPDQASFYRLRSGGLISGVLPQDAQFRCGIYGTYLKRHLA